MEPRPTQERAEQQRIDANSGFLGEGREPKGAGFGADAGAIFAVFNGVWQHRPEYHRQQSADQPAIREPAKRGRRLCNTKVH